jgi:eukaryotic-like serine/threonine-protein kinase
VPETDPFPKIILSGTDPDLPKGFSNGFTKYSNFKPMASGGKAVLTACWDSVMGRTVCLKTLHPKYADVKAERRRFLREARVTAQLQHPNTVPVYEIGEDDDDVLYFAMKRVAGEDLFQIIKRMAQGDETTLESHSVEFLAEIVVQASQALAFAHRHGVIHRDVKPENIWVGNFGEVLLLDWGVAKVWGVSDDEDEVPSQGVGGNTSLLKADDEQLQTLTQSGQMPGTPLYMSPEQVLGHKYIDERSDIFSMGIVLYELMCFREPFRGPTIRHTFDKIVNDAPLEPRKAAPQRNISESLEAICLKALEKDPADRFQSITQLIEAIRVAVR